MTKNDTFFKILFAIQLALLPMVLFAKIILDDWTVGLFICAVLIARLWCEILKDKNNKLHTWLTASSSFIIFTFMLSFLYAYDRIGLAILIIGICLLFAYNIYKGLFFSKSMPELMNAVDYCFMLFELFTLGTLCFVMAFPVTSMATTFVNIGFFAMTLTAISSVGYKIFYTFKYTQAVDVVKNLFSRKK